jgi:hypothetical protein
VTQIISVFGAILILAAYLGVQVKLLPPGQLLFSLVNLVGSGALAYVAIVEEQIGFILLEGVWAMISFVVLVRLVRAEAPDTAGSG